MIGFHNVLTSRNWRLSGNGNFLRRNLNRQCIFVNARLLPIKNHHFLYFGVIQLIFLVFCCVVTYCKWVNRFIASVFFADVYSFMAYTHWLPTLTCRVTDTGEVHATLIWVFYTEYRWKIFGPIFVTCEKNFLFLILTQPIIPC